MNQNTDNRMHLRYGYTSNRKMHTVIQKVMRQRWKLTPTLIPTQKKNRFMTAAQCTNKTEHEAMPSSHYFISITTVRHRTTMNKRLNTSRKHCKDLKWRIASYRQTSVKRHGAHNEAWKNECMIRKTTSCQINDARQSLGLGWEPTVHQGHSCKPLQVHEYCKRSEFGTRPLL